MIRFENLHDGEPKSCLVMGYRRTGKTAIPPYNAKSVYGTLYDLWLRICKQARLARTLGSVSKRSPASHHRAAPYS